MNESKPVFTEKRKVSCLALVGFLLGVISLAWSLSSARFDNESLILFIGLLAMICGAIADTRRPINRWSFELSAVAVGLLTIVFLLLPPVFRSHHPRFGSLRNECINNLRQIDGAKQQWALENRKERTDTPTPTDLDSYLKKSFNTVYCPRGGVYTINSVGQKPTCSISDHVLP